MRILMLDLDTLRPDPKRPRHPGALRNMVDLRRMMDGYDCGIRYMDGHIGMLLDAMRKAGVMEDLAIIVTSDHGENMGELGIYRLEETGRGWAIPELRRRHPWEFAAQ